MKSKVNGYDIEIALLERDSEKGDKYDIYTIIYGDNLNSEDVYYIHSRTGNISDDEGSDEVTTKIVKIKGDYIVDSKLIINKLMRFERASQLHMELYESCLAEAKLMFADKGEES